MAADADLTPELLTQRRKCPYIFPRIGCGGGGSAHDPLLAKVRFYLSFGTGGGDRTRPPNYKVPWNHGVAAARQIRLLILLTNSIARHEMAAEVRL